VELHVEDAEGHLLAEGGVPGPRKGLELGIFDDQTLLVLPGPNYGPGTILATVSSRGVSVERVDPVQVARSTHFHSATHTALATIFAVAGLMALGLAFWARDWTILIFAGYFATLVVGSLYNMKLLFLWSEVIPGFSWVEVTYFPLLNAFLVASFAGMLHMGGVPRRKVIPLFGFAVIFCIECPLWMHDQVLANYLNSATILASQTVALMICWQVWREGWRCGLVVGSTVLCITISWFPFHLSFLANLLVAMDWRVWYPPAWLVGLNMLVLPLVFLSAVALRAREQLLQSQHLRNEAEHQRAVALLQEQAITERERTIHELAAARDEALAANSAKSRFLAAASHDLRQPIQAIGLFHHALKKTGLNQAQLHLHDLLGKSVGNLGDLLNSLLDISRLDAGVVAPQFEAVSVKSLIQGLDAEFWPVAEAKSLRIRFCYPSTQIAVWADPKLLGSLLGNLIGNAIKYTDRGHVLVSVRRMGRSALCQVWDTGIGIGPEHKEAIFEEYLQIGNPQRDRTKGLGLGLAIVKRLAQLMNTNVSVRSQLGRGSVFEIKLPLAELPAVPANRISRSSDVAFSNLTIRRIMVIEDDSMVSTALTVLLESMGIVVVHCANAASALIKVHSRDYIDFYISDLRLPDINGLELLQQIQRTKQQPIKAAILTGDTSPDRIEVINSSPWPVLFKPVEVTQLLEVMGMRQSTL
jgi:signal transduction histidine kinase